MKNWIRLLALLAVGMVVGCGGDPNQQGAVGSVDKTGGSSSSSSAEWLAQEFTATRVEVGPDGAKVVAKGTITRAQQIARYDQRHGIIVSPDVAATQEASSCVDVDTTCADSELWIYDETDEEGTELCVYATGANAIADFGDALTYGCLGSWVFEGGLYFCTKTWIGSVRSYWPGDQDGFFFSATANCCSACGEFDVYGNAVNADSCEQSAGYLGLDGVCNGG
jgi:hypothetical protein